MHSFARGWISGEASTAAGPERIQSGLGSNAQTVQFPFASKGHSLPGTMIRRWQAGLKAWRA
jgi:hypothetical protein